MKRFLKATVAVMAIAVVAVVAFQIVTFLRKDKNLDVQAETVAPII